MQQKSTGTITNLYLATVNYDTKQQELGLAEVKRNLPLADKENEDKRSDGATRFPHVRLKYANIT